MPGTEERQEIREELKEAEAADLQESAKESGTETPKKSRKKKKAVSLLREFLALIIKLLIVGVIGIILFGYVFGLLRNQSLDMQPAAQDGDLLLYYRIAAPYEAGQLVIVQYKQRKYPLRVIAAAGDTVDITEDGLIVNGSFQQEAYVMGRTERYEAGIDFPVTVPEGKVFVLGDNRQHATDSRIFGCVEEKDILGRIIGLFRRRNF